MRRASRGKEGGRQGACRPVNYDIVALHDVQCIRSSQALGENIDRDPWIDIEQFPSGAFDFRVSDITREMDDLPLEVGHVDDIRVRDPESSDSGSGQVKGRRASEAAGAHDEDTRVLQPGLTLDSDSRDDYLTGIAHSLAFRKPGPAAAFRDRSHR